MTGTVTALNLARAQFAFTVSFHFIFPAFSIGLASYLAVLEALWLTTGKGVYANLYRYWIKIFSIVFGMGVVSGIVMSYQFGTNWAVFSDKAGPIVGPLMAYEVLSAFFLEAGFLGVMLFGINKVGPKLHFLATCMVALGTLLSATWILAANSWMHTPVGWMMNEAGQFVPKGSWLPIIFSPSFPYRFVHTVIAAYLTTSLAVGAVGAWHLLRDRHNLGARTMFSMAMWMAAIVAPIQILAGDTQGLNTQEYEPAKIMAMEGHFDSYAAGAPLVLLGIPDEENRRMNYSVEIPKLSSLVLAHDLNAPLAGLNTIPRRDWPPVTIIFWSFRVMVALGMAILGLGLLSLLARVRGNLYEWPLLHRLTVLMGPAGFIAVIAGWVTTEVGRQPFTIYHVLRTADAVSPIASPGVTGSLLAFVVVYFGTFVSGAVYIVKLMAKAPSPRETVPEAAPTHAAGITPAAALRAGTAAHAERGEGAE
jgi:cytochrome d ubiquinol oxidase subunit I